MFVLRWWIAIVDDDSDDDVDDCRPGEDDETPRDLTLHEQRDRGAVSRCCLIAKSPPPPRFPGAEPVVNGVLISYRWIWINIQSH